MWLCLAVVVVAFAVVNLAGCGVGGGSRGWLASALGIGPGTPGASDDGGGALPSLWGSASRSFARLDWWLGLGAGVCILVGVYRALRGDIAGGGGAIAVGIGLVLINALVGLILPSIFYIAVIATFVVGGVVAWRLATGRGIGGHTLHCLWTRIVGGVAAHHAAHKVKKKAARKKAQKA
jgi:hypothetical protein